MADEEEWTEKDEAEYQAALACQRTRHKRLDRLAQSFKVVAFSFIGSGITAIVFQTPHRVFILIAAAILYMLHAWFNVQAFKIHMNITNGDEAERAYGKLADENLDQRDLAFAIMLRIRTGGAVSREVRGLSDAVLTRGLERGEEILKRMGGLAALRVESRPGAVKPNRVHRITSR